MLFVNEEPPYDRTPDMGSYRFAKTLKDQGESVAGMISLETSAASPTSPAPEIPVPFGHIFSN